METIFGSKVSKVFFDLDMKKIFALLTVIMILSACGGDVPEVEKKTVPRLSDLPPGKLIYKKNCVLCHGAKGNMGLNGSFDLTTSKLTLEERIEVITSGRNTMMPYKSVLTKNEIKEVSEYIETLRK